MQHKKRFGMKCVSGYIHYLLFRNVINAGESEHPKAKKPSSSKTKNYIASSKEGIQNSEPRNYFNMITEQWKSIQDDPSNSRKLQIPPPKSRNSEEAFAPSTAIEQFFVLGGNDKYLNQPKQPESKAPPYGLNVMPKENNSPHEWMNQMLMNQPKSQIVFTNNQPAPPSIESLFSYNAAPRPAPKQAPKQPPPIHKPISPEIEPLPPREIEPEPHMKLEPLDQPEPAEPPETNSMMTLLLKNNFNIKEPTAIIESLSQNLQQNIPLLNYTLMIEIYSSKEFPRTIFLNLLLIDSTKNHSFIFRNIDPLTILDPDTVSTAFTSDITSTTITTLPLTDDFKLKTDQHTIFSLTSETNNSEIIKITLQIADQLIEISSNCDGSMVRLTINEPHSIEINYPNKLMTLIQEPTDDSIILKELNENSDVESGKMIRILNVKN
ncbi:MAG: hypothetical protein Hyperionvirus15_54 [Hyperionvirus sp.]|uniref:Uncharacterized protein n=1 Tax=Hyperionvirus sp. TaxID=2487770 RepID=A0A3G5A9R2_9VIRU|nr:MAG: hypothetical protein Hyperionvirus15_54 [Hyperionvirus sp.]